METNTPYTSGGEAKTYLMDEDGNFIHIWNHERGPASMPYLLQDRGLFILLELNFPQWMLVELVGEFKE